MTGSRKNFLANPNKMNLGSYFNEATQIVLSLSLSPHPIQSNGYQYDSSLVNCINVNTTFLTQFAPLPSPFLF